MEAPRLSLLDWPLSGPVRQRRGIRLPLRPNEATSEGTIVESPRRRGTAITFVTLLGALLPAIVFTNPYLPPIHYSYFAASVGAQALHYDSGDGINEAQRVALEPKGGPTLKRLPPAFANRDLSIAFTLNNQEGANIPRPLLATSGEPRAGDTPGQVEFPIKAADRVAIFQVPNPSALVSVKIIAGSDRFDVPAAEATPAGGMMLVDRSQREMWAGFAMHRMRLGCDWIQGVQVRSTPESNAPGYHCLVASSSETAVPIALQKASGSEPAHHQRAIDLASLARHAHPVRNTIQAILAVILAASATFTIGIAGKARRQGGFGSLLAEFWRDKRVYVLLFSPFLAIFACWTAGQWPGLLGWDSTSAPQQVARLEFNPWYSLVYPLFLMMLVQLGGAWTNLLVFQTLATALLGAIVFGHALRQGAAKAVVLPLAAVFALSPVIGSYNAFYTRDVISGLVNAALLFAVFRACSERVYGGRFASRSMLCVLLSALVFSALLRKDNAPLCVVAIIGLSACQVAPWRRMAWLAAAWCAGVYAVEGPVSTAVMGDQAAAKSRYAVAAMVNPMGALIAGDYWTASPEADRQVIERILPYEAFKNEWTPYWIGYWSRPCEGKQYSDQEIADFRRLLVRAAAQNLDIVLGARTRTLFAVLGSAKTWYVSDFSRTNENEGGLRDLGLWRDRPLSGRVYDFQSKLVWELITSRSVVWSAVPQFAVLLLTISGYRWWPIAAAVAAALAARLGVVFLAAPASHFFYVYDLYLFGIFLIPLVLTERRMRQATPPANAQ